jgi:hypothetical protein
MATVDKNFRIKNGLAVEGTTATVNGENILREGSGDSYIINLIGGTATSDNTPSTVVKRDSNGGFSAGTIALTGITVQNAGSIYEDSSFIIESNSGYAIDIHANQDVNITSQNGDIVLNPDGNSYLWSKTNANQIATHSYADDVASNAQSAAQLYADGLAGNYDPAGAADTALQSAEGYADQVSGQALADAENYTDTAITNLNLSGTYDALGAATTALNDAKAYTDQEVSALVDSAPALLDTLNELAAAIADNPNYATDVANLVATKADTTYVDSEISGVDTAAQGYATTAENNAKSYADGLASNYDAAGAASNALNDANSYTDSAISNGNSNATPSYRAINLGGYTEQVGNWAQAGTAGTQVTAFSYSAGWGSAEFLVRIMSNTSGHQHSQLSKLLVTTDGAGNVAITEYGIVTTNGNMGDVTASNVGGTINILVTPTYASSEVIVSGTLLAYND